jgi:dipeptide/tripeptide permease
MHRASHGKVSVVASTKKKKKAQLIRSCFIFIEIHLFWAQHQVHHSSEEFNVTVGVRQSVFQSLVGVVSRKKTVKPFDLPV